jgi:hypothetical protein
MFPFYWIGVATAAVFLLAVLAIFGALARLLGVAELGVRDSIVPGLLSGFRGWTDERGSRLRRMVSPAAPDASDGDTAAPPSVVTHRLHPRIH